MDDALVLTAAAALAAGATCYATNCGQWLLDLLSEIFDDTSDDESAREECEEECDLEWDRNKFICDATGAMYGFRSREYRTCRDRIDSIYVECYQDSSSEECTDE